VVAYAGNLDPYQDLSVLLEAMVEVRRAEPTAVLEVVTHASCRLLERQMERLGLEAQVRLIIAENYAAVGPVLERADVLVCPRTSWSGFPIKLLNYMAAGRPMVVAAGAARALGDGPWTVVPDGDARALAGALVGALRDPAGQSHLGQASRRRLHEMYDWRRLAPRVEQLYDAVLSRRRDAADETGASCEKALQNAAV
jgi:glycosyltransferase involved in cell wall biosynthesis